MKTASVKEIKNELQSSSHEQLSELLMRVVRFKKENKEFLTYLLFESENEQEYITNIKETLHLLFTEVNVKSLYITKKNIRKIVRLANRFIKYSSETVTLIEVYIYICEEINDLQIDLKKSTALLNLYNSLVKKIEKQLLLLHEDLRYDYHKELVKILNS
ncbi:MAG: hypothetical protein ABIP80_06170 [Ferruginibacter sp.]